MKLLLLTFLMLASPVMAQNPSWDAWREQQKRDRGARAIDQGLLTTRNELIAMRREQEKAMNVTLQSHEKAIERLQFMAEVGQWIVGTISALMIGGAIKLAFAKSQD